MEDENAISQEHFDHIIKNEARGKKDFIISEPLHGIINLGIFGREQIKVNRLQFAKGTITGVVNVPEGLQSINISENMLTHLPVREMRNLVEITCDNNKIFFTTCFVFYYMVKMFL